MARELAILGGQPTFDEPLYVGRPNVGDIDEFLARMRDVLERRWLTNSGPLVLEFERRIAEFVGVRNCVAMCNATIALEVVTRALGLEGEVIVPSMTFVATAHALWWQKIRPVFCDIDEQTHTLDPERVEELITPRTTGIIGVHLWGHSCDVEALEALAERNGLALLFDAAHAFACRHDGRMVGGGGNAEILSFHATKFFNTFEGGALVTDDDELARRVRLMQNFGFRDYDDVIGVGTNGKMTEASAAMGLTSLGSVEAFLDVNVRNLAQYREELMGLPGIRIVEPPAGDQTNRQYIVLEIAADEVGLTRDELMNVLWAENVIARRYFYPGCHQMEPYRSLDPEAGRRLPVTERLVRRVLLLPTGTAVGHSEVARIAQILRTAIEQQDPVRRLLRSRVETNVA